MRSDIERMIVSVARSHRSEWSTVSAYGTHAGAATTMLCTLLEQMIRTDFVDLKRVS
jgi:DNA-directed RNA polymerase